ncbi:hypothetical protein N9J52_04670, partial [Flavobacteriales bacterium]|nr:hypothetical protein [Flavobacteriales bacterium]
MKNVSLCCLLVLFISSMSALGQVKPNDTDFTVSYSPSFSIGDGFKFSQFIEMENGDPLVVFSKGKDLYTAYQVDQENMEIESLGTLELKDSKNKTRLITVGKRLLLPYFQSS